MLKKYIIFALSAFNLTTPNSIDDPNIELQISKMKLNFFIALFLIITIIFAIYHLQSALVKYLALFENKIMLEFISFGSILAICCIGLFMLKKRAVKKRQTPIENYQDNIDVPVLLISFASGIVESYQEKKHERILS